MVGGRWLIRFHRYSIPDRTVFEDLRAGTIEESERIPTGEAAL